jgi:acyl carrier protein
MELKEFIEKLKPIFEEANPDTVTAEAKIRDIEGYSSLIALSIIALVDEEFKVRLRGDDFRHADTLEDLFKIITLK